MTKKELERENKILRTVIEKARKVLEKDQEPGKPTNDYVERYGLLVGRLGYYLGEEYHEYLFEMEKLEEKFDILRKYSGNGSHTV